MRWLPLVVLLLVACKDSDRDGTSDRRDCADHDPLIGLDAEEVCNGKDDDCDGQVDEDVSFVAYWDRDGDGFGDEANSRRVCTLPEDGSLVAGDCDDVDPLTHPGAIEICDERDNDCDLEIDEDAELNLFHVDADGDGHGAPGATIEACLAPEGYAPGTDDCDDADATVHPGAPELCDERDNDCDLEVDEDIALVPHWPDADGDGSGDATATLATYACAPEPGTSADRLDCADDDPAIGPHAAEVQGNDVDEDCDGYLDEYEIPSVYPTIDDALAAAPDHAVVQYEAGIHYGTVDLGDRDVILAGEGCGRTVLYGDQLGTVLTMRAGTVADLSLEGGSGTAFGAATTDGGGLVVLGSVVAERVCVEANSASGRGGGIAVLFGDLTVRDSEVADNLATDDGGGIFVAQDATLTLSATRVVGNQSLDEDGGGISTHGGTLELSSCVVAGNEAQAYGGGLKVGVAGIWDAVGLTEILGRGTATVTNCTFHGNELGGKRGAAIWNYGSTVTVHNSVFTGHTQGIEVIEDLDAEDDLDAKEVTVTTVTHSAFAGNTAWDYELFWYVDGLRLEPGYVLVDPALPASAWDLHLLAGSELIDAGDPDLADRDLTVSDLGGYGGELAPRDFDLGYGDDTDADGILDGFEIRHGLRRYADDASDDPDADGLSNLGEGEHATDPHEADTDADGVTDADEVTAGADPLRAADQAPVAVAGPDVWELLGPTLPIDGSRSFDPNADGLAFDWVLVSAPIGSAVTGVLDPAAIVAELVPDLPGAYVLRLEVSDGGATVSDEVTVHALDAHIVPDDFASVQEAIDASVSGDTIAIRPGTWVGLLDPGGRDLTLVGLGAREEVVLDGASAGSVLTLDQGEALTLARLTIQNGVGREGAGIDAQDADSLELFDVIVRDNHATSRGGGIHLVDSELVAADSLFLRNTAVEGGGLWSSDSEIDVVRSTFASNAATTGGAVRIRNELSSGAGGVCTIENSVLQDNTAVVGAAYALDDGSNLVHLLQSAVVGNRGGSIVFAENGRHFHMNTVFAENAADDFQFDGFEDLPYFLPIASGSWQNTGPVWYGRAGLPSEVDPFVETDPRFAAWTRDGDPSNDHFASRPGSALLDAGFIDWADLDETRSDIGPAGGTRADPALRRYQLDVDADGMSDGWEVLYGLDPSTNDSSADADADTLTNAVEYDLGTDPTRSDSDGDGISDAAEGTAGTDPTNAGDNRPVAVAGGPYDAVAGETLFVDGSDSNDPNGDPLTWSWRLVSAPAGSAVTNASLVGATSPVVSLVPDVRGFYVLGLVVSDGSTSSIEAVAVAFAGVELSVPDGYATIEDALAAAEEGDVVQLAAGAYDVALSDFPVRVTLKGAGMDETYLQGTGLGPIVEVTSGQAVDLADLTLTGSTNNIGGAVACDDGTITIARVRAEGNVGQVGGAMAFTDCEAALTDVDMIDNVANFRGGAIWTDGGNVSWVRGEVARNVASNFGGAIFLYHTALTLKNLRIHHNASGSKGGALYQDGGDLLAEHLTVVANHGTVAALHVDEGTVVTHSILQENVGYGLEMLVLFGALDTTYNSWFGNLADTQSSPIDASQGLGSIQADAEFVLLDTLGSGALDDLRLRVTSPVIDAGADLDPDGSVSDLGAYGGPDAPPDFDSYYRDVDADGLSDGWEVAVGLDPTVDDSTGDPDADGLTNLAEQEAGTLPLVADTDGDGMSDGDEVAAGGDPLDATAFKPIAAAGADQVVDPLVPVQLSGAASTDPNGDPLTFRWSLVATPGRSSVTEASLVGATSSSAGFVPDSPGAYDLELVVNDGTVDSTPDVVRVTVTGDVMVPEDYADVAAAIDAVSEGWPVLVDAGIWPLAVDLAGRDATIIGAGRDLTILDGGDVAQVIRAWDGEQVALTDLTVTGGFGLYGGALSLEASAVATLTNVTIERNEALLGGGLYVDEGAVSAVGLRLVDNVGARDGGGMYAWESDVDLSHSLIAGNTAVFFHGGGLYLSRSTVLITSSILTDNTANDGGGMFLSSLSVAPLVLTLDHVTATYNTALSDGGFLYTLLGDILVTNSIIANHTGEAVAHEIGREAVSLAVTHSLFDGNVDGDFKNFVLLPVPSAAEGNVFADAGLTGVTDNGDWTDDSWVLDPVTSAAIDAGDPASPDDVDGSPPDMGAFGGPLGDWVP